ncbi:MAG: alpha/beta fold hydrolase [Chloroflexi bacterium]|nr:alpha/beta fold hydrolase [Chloroflexota bacterium]
MTLSQDRIVHVAIDPAVQLEGALAIPAGAEGIVLFAHGSGSSRHSPRNKFVAHTLNQGGIATLLIDLLTADEEKVDMRTRHLRFDIDFLAERVARAIDWLDRRADTQTLNLGLFGASTGAAAALVAAAGRPHKVSAIVSRGGRPDLAAAALSEVEVPTLLIVGGNDAPVIGLNQQALAQLTAMKRLEIVPGATHLFEEPGKLEAVAELAQEWFATHLSGAEV